MTDTARRKRQVMSDGSPAPVVPRGGWSDGVHFVRVATDRRPLPYIVRNHKHAPSFYRRRLTLDEAIATGKEQTQRAITASPALALKLAGPPVEVCKAPKIELEPFSTTHFTCICANSIAQVWQCTSLSGSKRPVGRRRADGRAPKQTPVRHAVGECAVLMLDKPVREEDGRVRVFRFWQEADDYALHLWSTGNEDDKFRLGPIVFANEKVQVLFDPDNQPRETPFILWLPAFNRPVWAQRTKPLLSSRPALMSDEDWERTKKLDRVPTFEERPERFGHIISAIATAERLVGRNWSPPV